MMHSNPLAVHVLCILLLSNVCFVSSESIYKLSVEDHEGNTLSLKKYDGMATLIVNVASHCGYTEGTYKALTRLHDILSYGGYFSVLAFPCNQFGEQEPDEASEIVTTMQYNFGVEFPIFNKVDVIGADASPVFRNLIAQSSVVPDWNFYKYLVDWKGEVLNAWGTTTTIEEIFDEIQAAVEEAKAKGKSGDSPAEEVSKQEAEKDEKDEL